MFYSWVLSSMLTDTYSNTYTNKTWSEVSGITLEEINRMEREFLLGIDFGLYVDKTTYVSWLNLLQGLVMAKERDSRRWRRTPRSRTHPQPRQHRPVVYAPHPIRTKRARSSSPSRSALYHLSTPESHNPPAAVPEYHTPPRSGSKRSATDAFSPTSTSFPPVKAPRRPMNLSLDIPERSQGAASANSISPSEPLQHFSKLSLGASPAGVKPLTPSHSSPAWASTVKQPVVPQTLASAYRVDPPRTHGAPQVRFTLPLTLRTRTDRGSEPVLLFSCLLANRGGASVPEGSPAVPPTASDLSRLQLCRTALCAHGRPVCVGEPTRSPWTPARERAHASPLFGTGVDTAPRSSPCARACRGPGPPALPPPHPPPFACALPGPHPARHPVRPVRERRSSWRSVLR